MKVIDKGHHYELDGFYGTTQEIKFIKKEPENEFSSKLVTVHDGTTNEELLNVLIDRCKNLYEKFPSGETMNAIKCMEIALYSLESRTRDRIARGVEGKQIK